MTSLHYLFRNEHFALLHKPCGVLTVPSHQGRADPRAVLGIQLQDEVGVAVLPVHRLDVEVSGLVLFALSAVAHRQANGWFEHQLVQKTYRAWTTPQGFAHIPAHIDNPRQSLGLAPDQTFEWHGRIERGKRRAYPSPHGKPSHTRATFLGQDTTTGYLGWDLQPLTGRPHQLRVDLSRHGFPILGDQLYGSEYVCADACIALVAWRLDFHKISQAERFGLPESVAIEPRYPDCTRQEM